MGKVLIGNPDKIAEIEHQSFIDCHIIIVVGAVVFLNCQFERCKIDRLKGVFTVSFFSCNFDEQPKIADTMASCFIANGPLNL